MSESKRPRGKYKTNWASYNASLKARGSLTVWLDKGMQWYAPATGKRGRNPVFSDAAIQFCLSIKMPLRFGPAPEPRNGSKPAATGQSGLEGAGLQHRVSASEAPVRQGIRYNA